MIDDQDTGPISKMAESLLQEGIYTLAGHPVTAKAIRVIRELEILFKDCD